MAERKAVTKEMLKRYRRGSKGDKGRVLDELCALTGWHRDYARRALRLARQDPAPPRARPVRQRRYGPDLQAPLEKVWATYGGLCGKRLAPFMAEGIEVLERFGELSLTPEQREGLVHMSAATIDRRLAGARRRLGVRGRSGTKPGTLLRRHIPVRTFADWDEHRPGFLEMDLVAHDGGVASGDYCQSLDATDVATGWTEPAALKNRAQRWVFEELKRIREVLPFPLLGVDSDNGAEFINHELYRYCLSEEITFTRGRAHRKNDGCFVEQKNWTVVRQHVGYARYDTDAELEVLRELYSHLRLWVNHFCPVMKLREKVRDGARVTRRYDAARTPYRAPPAGPAEGASSAEEGEGGGGPARARPAARCHRFPRGRRPWQPERPRERSITKRGGEPATRSRTFSVRQRSIVRGPIDVRQHAPPNGARSLVAERLLWSGPLEAEDGTSRQESGQSVRHERDRERQRRSQSGRPEDPAAIGQAGLV